MTPRYIIEIKQKKLAKFKKFVKNIKSNSNNKNEMLIKDNVEKDEINEDEINEEEIKDLKSWHNIFQQKIQKKYPLFTIC
jgi:type V secretory pathway adhesin AidA